tara:strand:- start:302 stop:871 length:570 start_codon:yes stop_codon:yes gene_type:complete
MWEAISRDILAYIRRPQCQYRIIERNGIKSAVMVVPMNGNVIEASLVENALRECEHASNALINMKKRRLEFQLRAPVVEQLYEDEQKCFQPELVRSVALEGVSDEDNQKIKAVAETMTRASTTGIVPRIEFEIIHSSECIMYGCNENCVYSHNMLDLDKDLLTYCFNTQEIMYTTHIELEHRHKRKKNN